MIGFIGAGHMASALVRGMVLGGVKPETLAAYDVLPACLEALPEGVKAARSLAELAACSDTLVLAIKPKNTQEVLDQLRGMGFSGVLVSIVLGFTQATLAAALPTAQVIRLMPNTPAEVGAGMLVFNANHALNDDAFVALSGIFAACGRVSVLPEAMMDGVTGISGSGPAYVYLFIEAFADAGVREGLPRQTAYELAAQTVKGAAEMVLRTGQHPGALKDAVCSPGGSTIEAVYALEKAGLRAAVMDGVKACAQKAAGMAK
ncbi:MAG: pyrroline-5-carboxylate reductase [Oscillospiraceae bacterium]|jgi:pyrroline-5-carboxylate reductase|nr:pyrroline-5-carboxylate reductase [Oscillospiraceae bacterium]